MKSGLSPGNCYRGALLFYLLACLAGRTAAFEEGESGWEPHSYQAPEPWRELDSELPAYPQEKHLVDTGVDTAGFSFTIYVDAPSISVDEDQVVRYTVVIISDDDIWNVSHEGLHCGKKAYRRYAYGMNGEWQELADSPWLPLDGAGINAYRMTFYMNYMCDPTKPFLKPEQIIRKFRSRRLAGDDG